MPGARRLTAALSAEQDPLLAPTEGIVYNEAVATATLGPDAQALDARRNSWSVGRELEELPWWKRPSIYWLLGPFFIFTLAYGGSLVPKLNLYVGLPLMPSRPLADPHVQHRRPRVSQALC